MARHQSSRSLHAGVVIPEHDRDANRITLCRHPNGAKIWGFAKVAVAPIQEAS
jgi:hypothetical protein